MSSQDPTSQKVPEVLSRDLAYEGLRFNVERLKVRSAGGQMHAWDVVRHPGAAVILPITDDGRVVFVRNVRMPLEATLLELPAGTVEPPEPPEVTAARELTEETGYTAASLEPIGSFYSAPGFCDELLHAFVATGVTAGEQQLDAGEQIVIEHHPYDEAIAMCVDGRLRDAKSVSALLIHHVRRQGGSQ
jgi:ADP-ribose pyrophosphatase